MNNKPKRSAGGLARLMQMSDVELYVIVEGRDHDRPHYERLLQACPSTMSKKIQIRLAEQIDIKGISAGGKSHALTIYEFLKKENYLHQRSSLGNTTIVFMLDRDRDDFIDRALISDHIIYTHGTDVESDILLNADIWSAIGVAYGIDLAVLDVLQDRVGRPPETLFLLWKEWIILGLVALECGVAEGARWAQMSEVNSQKFGFPDSELSDKIGQSLIANSSQQKYILARKKAQDFVQSKGVKLLKGRWIARYISYIIQSNLSSEIMCTNIRSESVIKICLATIRYSGDWFNEYEMRLSKLLRWQ